MQLGDGHGNAVDVLLRALVPREMLLVLDNCEHLATEVGALAHAILSAAPRMRLLATSQELLKVAGERVYRLDPLGVPPPDTAVGKLLDFTAAQLLHQRVRLIDRRFDFSAENAASVVALLRHLDGIPLAIEMAAARLPLLGPQALDARLSEWLRLLRGASHGVPARQHTLRATLDWSHSLLALPEQAVLRRLSMFAGSFRIDTAQRTAAGLDLDDDAVLDGLAALVDKSLVQVERLDPPRYRLLETMRLYAAEQLAEHGETAAVDKRHGQAMAVLAVEVEARFWEMGDRPWLDEYACEYDDLQAAFDRACTRSNVDVAASIGSALQRLDMLRDVNAPRRRRAEALFATLTLADPLTTAVIWRCLASDGTIAVSKVSRLEAGRQAVAAWRSLQDLAELHFALGFYAGWCARSGDYEVADAQLAEMQNLENPAWPLRRRLWGALIVAGVCLDRGDAAAFRKIGPGVLELAERAGASRSAAWMRLKLFDAALMVDEIDEAIEIGKSVVQEYRDLAPFSALHGLALSKLCEAHLLKGQHDAARACANEALPLLWLDDWGYRLADPLALLASREGHSAEAAHLLGFVDGWFSAHQTPRERNEARLAHMAAATIEAELGAQVLATLRHEGARLTDDEARFIAEKVLGIRLDT